MNTKIRHRTTVARWPLAAPAEDFHGPRIYPFAQREEISGTIKGSLRRVYAPDAWAAEKAART